ncbi:hypothetical protein GEMRC1_000071 [Eukaryota sp. GEM-RC1]
MENPLRPSLFSMRTVSILLFLACVTWCSCEIVASDDHGDASADGYAIADVVDTLTLSEGSWKITATGSANLNGDPTAFNCGLRVVDEDSVTGYKMLGKVNPAIGGESGRVGFAVVGALLDGDEDTEVELVCFGGGNLPFEYNLVAVKGTHVVQFDWLLLVVIIVAIQLVFLVLSNLHARKSVGSWLVSVGSELYNL